MHYSAKDIPLFSIMQATQSGGLCIYIQYVVRIKHISHMQVCRDSHTIPEGRGPDFSSPIKRCWYWPDA